MSSFHVPEFRFLSLFPIHGKLQRDTVLIVKTPNSFFLFQIFLYSLPAVTGFKYDIQKFGPSGLASRGKPAMREFTIMWKQNFDPLHNIWLSALVAALPIFYLFWALAIRKMKGILAGLSTTAVAVALAIVVFGMPAGLALAATLHGALYGLFPIGWIVLSAVFLYNITIRSGQFEVIKDSIASITADRRLQALLIAFSFGAFLEGCAGFGAPVAITAAMLVGLGFNPLYAAGLCLIANTAPVAFGSIGTPIIAAGQVTGIDDFVIAQMVGRQLPLLSMLVPFWLVMIMSGWRGAREVWPAALVSGISFAVAQWWSSNVLGAMLPDIIASLTSILCLVVFLKFWKPKTIFRFANEAAAHTYTDGAAPGARQILKAWSPFIILTVIIGNWGLKPVKALLDTLKFDFGFPVIHNAVINPDTGKALEAIFKFNWLSAAGTAVLITAGITIAINRMRPAEALQVFGKTLKSMVFPLITIAAVLGYAYIGNFSGMTQTLGLALAHTGSLFPLFSPMLGWIGVFITGSDTSANAVFGKLQTVSAQKLGISSVLTIAANSSGGVTGKMISPQSIAVACAATGLIGRESSLFRFTIAHSLAFLAALCVLTWLQATLLAGMVPALVRTAAATGGVDAAHLIRLGAIILGTTVVGVAVFAALLSRRDQPAPLAAGPAPETGGRAGDKVGTKK